MTDIYSAQPTLSSRGYVTRITGPRYIGYVYTHTRAEIPDAIHDRLEDMGIGEGDFEVHMYPMDYNPPEDEIW